MSAKTIEPAALGALVAVLGWMAGHLSGFSAPQGAG
jgi:hypothetical protein